MRTTTNEPQIREGVAQNIQASTGRVPRREVNESCVPSKHTISRGLYASTLSWVHGGCGAPRPSRQREGCEAGSPVRHSKQREQSPSTSPAQFWIPSACV